MLISRQDAAVRLGTSARFVDKLRKNGELRSFKINRMVKIDSQDIETYLAMRAEKRGGE
jgi:excisionase family DNA binding protein